MMRLLDMLFPPRVDEILLRDTPLETFLALSTPRLTTETHPETVTLFPFHEPVVRAALHEAKYHGSARAYKYLGAALADYIRDADDIKKPILVPLPLGQKRRRERGYNQVEEIVESAAAELDLTIDPTLLRRVHETVSQVSLPREKREENMRGAFRATRQIDPTHTYIIIDDVITTGATLGAALRALEAAGATHIVPLALAH